MAIGVIKKIIQQIPKKVPKKVPKKKIRKVDPKSPFAHVDELARPLHRGAGPSGVQKKKYRSPKHEGGLMSGVPKIAKKGWK